jgi:uncharacterized protein
MPHATEAQLLLALCMLGGAVLYSAVGHAGASAYIALMALFGVSAVVMRPTALVLNIFVASFVSWRYVRAGQFRWRTVWPILIGSVPLAVYGGSIQLPGHLYRPLVGAVLLASAVRFLWPEPSAGEPELKEPPVALAIASGAVIGLLSGLTGTGGGIFLSPLLIFMAWSTTKAASGIAAVFILCNSIAGLLGNIASVKSLPSELPLYVGAVIIGAVVGSALGVKLAPEKIRKALGVVLLIAGAKMFGLY